jgi:Uncharacterized protein containing caspase domain
MKKWSLVILIAACAVFVAVTGITAETRGLSIVAKDLASGRQGEVKLYNKSYAVIIGIDQYKNLPPGRQLQNAVKDAKGVEEVLRKSYQFDRIITLLNEQATKDRIMEVLTEELPAQMDRDDALFLFWAGHGNQEKSEYGDLGYLIPYDGDTDKIRKNLTMAEIRDTISKKIPAKHIFYVMDACYSGLLTTRSVDGKTRRDLSYLKEITKESVRQVLTAGGKGEEALDGGPGGHSVFTGRLIEILSSAPDFITANELQASIKEKVYSDARARNHVQTPDFGALYGLGDFVFIPKLHDRLGNMTGASAARQKELEKLRKAEQEAIVAKKQEEAEIEKKKKELAVLDKQIAEMKGRLGTSTAHNDDSLDQILALAEQKEEQGKSLEALRQQREAEERKRQQEIERLRQDALEKRAVQVNTDLAKYQKVASSRYAGEMRDAAWQAMVANYPEAKNVKVGDVDGFLVALGLARMTYTDLSSGLMWAAKDNGAGITWQEAKKYCEAYRGGGYTDWRMPTQEELAGLYDSAVVGKNGYKLTNLIELTSCCLWASETRDYDAALFAFDGGYSFWLSQSIRTFYRALPVRSAK